MNSGRLSTLYAPCSYRLSSVSNIYINTYMSIKVKKFKIYTLQDTHNSHNERRYIYILNCTISTS